MTTKDKDKAKDKDKDKDHAVVPPTVPPSGFARRKNEIIFGLTLLTVVYIAIYFGFYNSPLFRAADEYCGNAPDEETCIRSDLFGFQVSSGIMQLFMGTTGFLAWQWTQTAHKSLPNTPTARLFGYLEDADKLNAGILVFQLWDFIFSLLIPEHRTAVFLAHHVLSGMTAWFSLQHQLFHHYAIFFGGCSEISTIFLVVCDFDVFFPASSGPTGSTSWWALFVTFCQVGFTIAFLYYRIVGWCFHSIQLWKDVLYVTQTKKGLAEQYRPGKTWFLYLFLFMDVALGSLQIYWFAFGIIPKIRQVLQEQ